MRTLHHGLLLFFPLILTAVTLGACSGGDGASGTDGSGSSSSGAGGSADPCAGKACGDTCSDCPPGAPCAAQACNSAGECVLDADVVCSLCPDSEPAEGSACPKVGLVCDLEDGIIIP